MKLVQLNAWAGRLEKQIANFMRDEKPDIVCLQEIISSEQADSGFFLTLENIQEITGLKYAVMAPVYAFNYQSGAVQYGNAILSRYPILKSETIFTYLEYKHGFVYGNDSANVRNFVHTVLEIDGKECNVITHHGYHVPEHKNGNEETLRQMAQLAEYIEQLVGPVILAGDFNLAPHSESLEILNATLENVCISHHLKTTRTPLTHKTEVCDYIFVNKPVEVMKFHAADDVISDHKALLLDFKI